MCNTISSKLTKMKKVIFRLIHFNEHFLGDSKLGNKNEIAIWLLHLRKRVKFNDKSGLRKPARMDRV